MVFTRRFARMFLGGIWILDGLLQLKPQMFTSQFIKQVLLPNADGQPALISSSIKWIAAAATPHIVVLNVLFVLVQLAIGLAIVLEFRTRLTLIASFIWCALVWWTGEGFGSLFTGQALAITGAPGAVVLYTLVGIAAWPETRQAGMDPPLERTFAVRALSVLWLLAALMQIQPAYLSPDALSGAFMSPWAASIVKGHGTVATVVLSVVEAAIGIGIFFRPARNAAAWASIVLSILFWWTGQGFGQMQTPLGTDPNSGPLWVLLTLCAVPTLLNEWSAP